MWNFKLHRDMLEDYITGRFHETLLGKTKDFYSVLNINSNFFILVWCVMAWIVFLVSLSVVRWPDNVFSSKIS